MSPIDENDTIAPYTPAYSSSCVIRYISEKIYLKWRTIQLLAIYSTVGP